MRTSGFRGLAVVSLAIALAVGGCARQGDDIAAATAEEANDPIEVFNRHVFAINDAIDTFVIRPAAVTYRDGVPDPIKEAVRNFLDFLRAPVVLANDLFQGEWNRAEQTAHRFVAGIPVLGLVDLSGVPKHEEDFGQTLAVHGVEEGFYLVLPLIGPSNPRDAVGIAVDYLLDPVAWYSRANDLHAVTYGRPSVDAVDWRSRNIAEIDRLRAQSLDFYATVRTVHRQRRAAEIRNGRPSAAMPADDTSGEFREFVPSGEPTGATSAAGNRQ